ncbi:hypothetical protein [Candidatus Palauibacter sp.]|uniref:hypothetical protein n=2 Tax=Candidatus Palauibacter sp. TaxID=3101350 RepID=UPI003CC577F3
MSETAATTCDALHVRLAPRVLVALVAVVPLAGCGKDAPSATVPVVAIDSAGIQIVTNDPLAAERQCTLAEEPSFSVGTAEGDDAYMLYFVRGANRLSDGSVAILDNGTGQIRIFSDEGVHLRSMGGHGDGPGEFRIGRYIWVLPGDTLWVGDYRPWRFHIFTSSGELSRTVNLDPQYFNASQGGGVLANGTSVNMRSPFSAPRDDFQHPEPLFVEAHAADGTLIRELAALDGVRQGSWEGASVRMSTLFDPNPAVAAAGTTIAITTAREPEVRILDEDFNLHRVVRWSERDREVTSAHVQAYRDRGRSDGRA